MAEMPQLDEGEEESQTRKKDFEAGRKAANKENVVERAVDEGDNREIFEWISELSTQTALQVAVTRQSPRIGPNGKKVDGYLNTFAHSITREELQQIYGGGKFLLRVSTPNALGQMKFKVSRTIDIAGDPKMPRETGNEPEVVVRPIEAESKSLQGQVLSTMQEITRDSIAERRKVEETLRRQPGIDPMILEMFKSQREDAQRQLDLIMGLFNKPKETTTESRVVDKLIDQDNARITALRMQHESELRTLRDNAHADLKRAEDRADRLVDAAEKAHARELQALTNSYESRIQTLSLTHSSIVEQLKATNATLDRELTTAKTEIATLRGQKDKPVVEQLTEMMALKDAFSDMTGKDDTPGWQTAIEAIAGSPIAQGIAQRIASTPAAAPPQAQAPRRAPPRRGTVIQHPAQAQQARPARPGGTPPRPSAPPSTAVATATPVAPPANGNGNGSASPPQGQQHPPIELDPNEVALAVTFIENAISSHTQPADFAASFRSLVPVSLLKAIRVFGIDSFLEQVQVPAGSVLDTVEGRTFVRAVAKEL